MVDFTFHTEESAPKESAKLLKQAKEDMGFRPNLFAGLAESPETLQAYLSLDELFSKTSFSPEEQQTILLTISTDNGCPYCRAAHSTMAANNTRLTQEQLEAIQDKKSVGDSKLDQLITFADALVKQRGEMKDKQIESFLKAGYSRQNILELVLAASMKTISNYSNHMMKTKIDDQFKPQIYKLNKDKANTKEPEHDMA